jgi:hypothetical protein
VSTTLTAGCSNCCDSVLEAHRVGECLDGLRAAGEEGPVGRRGLLRAFQGLQVSALLLERVLGTVLRTEADGQAIIVLAEHEACLVEAADDAVLHQAAEHGALEIDEGQHHRLAAHDGVFHRDEVQLRIVKGRVGERVAELLDHVDHVGAGGDAGGRARSRGGRRPLREQQRCQ